jgi:hypothetical protein
VNQENALFSLPQVSITAQQSDSTSIPDTLTQETLDYPLPGLFDFHTKASIFCVESAGMAIEKYNQYEQFFYQVSQPPMSILS